jgi:hypothetical protein
MALDTWQAETIMRTTEHVKDVNNILIFSVFER